MPQVPPPIVKERARRLREASARRRSAWLERLIGTEQKILVERDGFGHSECFAPVSVTGFTENGSVVSVRISGRKDDVLVGEPV